YSKGDVVINPTFNGTGLKIKTFEALSFGKVLIGHPHSKIGIFEEANAPLFLCTTPDEYIRTLEDLFGSTEIIKKTKLQSISYIKRLNQQMIDAFDAAITIEI